MEALVERRRRGLLPAPGDVEEPDGARPARRTRGHVQQAGQVEGGAERRIDDALERQRVEDQRPLRRCGARPRQDPPTQASLPQTSWRTRRAPRNSSRPRSVSPTCGTTESSTSLDTLLRMRERVPLADVGAVRDAVDDPRVDAERRPAATPCRRRRRPSRRTAAGRRAAARRREPPRPAAERGRSFPSPLAAPGSRAHPRRFLAGRTSRPGSPAARRRGSPTRVRAPGRPAGRARPSGAADAPRRVDVVGGRDGQSAACPAAARVVERHGERRAGESGGAGTGVPAGSAGRAAEAPATRRPRRECRKVARRFRSTTPSWPRPKRPAHVNVDSDQCGSAYSPAAATAPG